MHSKKSLTYKSSGFWDCPARSKILRKKNRPLWGQNFKVIFLAVPGRIVFSSFCRSRKVVWNQSELKNRVGIRLVWVCAAAPRPASSCRHAENSESIRRGWLHPEFEFEIQKKFHDLAYWILRVSNMSFFLVFRLRNSWCTCFAPQAQFFGGFGAMRCVKVGEFSLLFFSSSLYWVALF